MNYNHINTILAAIEEGKEVQVRSDIQSPWSEPRPSQHLCESIGTLNNPSYWRIKPMPRKVPFTTSDIKPGMVFRRDHWDKGAWSLVTEIRNDGIFMGIGPQKWTWGELMNSGWLWSLDGETWHPCEREGWE